MSDCTCSFRWEEGIDDSRYYKCRLTHLHPVESEMFMPRCKPDTCTIWQTYLMMKKLEEKQWHQDMMNAPMVNVLDYQMKIRKQNAPTIKLESEK